MKDKFQEIWFNEIRERLNIRGITSSVLYGCDSLLRQEKFLIDEEKSEKKIVKALERMGCADKEVLIALGEYGKELKKIHFELGVRIGICLEAELLLKEEGK